MDEPHSRMAVVVSRAIVCNLHAHSTMVVGEGRKENVKEMRLSRHQVRWRTKHHHSPSWKWQNVFAYKQMSHKIILTDKPQAADPTTLQLYYLAGVRAPCVMKSLIFFSRNHVCVCKFARVNWLMWPWRLLQNNNRWNSNKFECCFLLAYLISFWARQRKMRD